MRRKFMLAAVVLMSMGAAACEQSATEPAQVRPQFDGGVIGEPCDPATYDGPYRCIPDPNNDGGYVIAT